MTDKSNVLVELKDVKKEFVTAKTFMGKPLKTVHAVDQVNLSIYEGETIGVVGESGCGKSTLGRSILRLINPTAGQVLYRGDDITKYDKEQMRQMRRKMQLIFQDPYASLNPRMTVLELIKAPLDAFGTGTNEERIQKVKEIMELVGMPENMMNRYPHEFSGGQRQRIVIARALVLDPEFVVCDEPVSALDVSVRAQVLNLIQDLQKTKKLTYLFISHDLSVVKYVSDRIAVMYLGQIVELADSRELFDHPLHPYSKALFDAVPLADPRTRKRLGGGVIEGEAEILPGPGEGCPFYPRCPRRSRECSAAKMELRPASEGSSHLVSCIHAGQEGVD